LIQWIIRLPHSLIGEASHLRDLILPDAVQLQPPRGIRAVGGKLPISIIAPFRISFGIRMAFDG